MKKFFALFVLCLFAAAVCQADPTPRFNPVSEDQIEAPTPTGTACACAKVDIPNPPDVNKPKPKPKDVKIEDDPDAYNRPMNGWYRQSLRLRFRR